MDDFAAKCEYLRVSYGATEVLRDLSFSVRPGEFVVVVGKSGTGKTTLLKAIAGLVETIGAIEVRGRTRMVFQNGLLLPWMSVQENVEIGLAAGTAKATAKALEMLRDVRMDGLAKRYPHELSGGERQRVAFARAFVAEPRIVCCDEPFGQLDVFTREVMQRWLLDFWTSHRCGVIFSTHSIEEALLLGDRVCVISEGRIGWEYRVPFSRPRDEGLRFTPEFLKSRKLVADQIVQSR